MSFSAFIKADSSRRHRAASAHLSGVPCDPWQVYSPVSHVQHMYVFVGHVGRLRLGACSKAGWALSCCLLTCLAHVHVCQDWNEGYTAFAEVMCF